MSVSGIIPAVSRLWNSFTGRPAEVKMDRKHDLYHIAWLLRQKVVPDLVAPIMEYADLYDEQVCSRPDYRVIEERNAPATLVLTPTLRTSSRLTHPMRSVDFTIISKDQGWSSASDGGSWTWFTAGIVRDNDTRGVTQEREIVRNPAAQREYTTHQIHWSASSDNPAEAAWVQGLQDGDKIIVRGWARYPGWQSFITNVEVRVAAVVIAR